MRRVRIYRGISIFASLSVLANGPQPAICESSSSKIVSPRDVQSLEEQAHVVATTASLAPETEAKGASSGNKSHADPLAMRESKSASEPSPGKEISLRADNSLEKADTAGSLAQLVGSKESASPTEPNNDGNSPLESEPLSERLLNFDSTSVRSTMADSKDESLDQTNHADSMPKSDEGGPTSDDSTKQRRELSWWEFAIQLRGALPSPTPPPTNATTVAPTQLPTSRPTPAPTNEPDTPQPTQRPSTPLPTPDPTVPQPPTPPPSSPLLTKECGSAPNCRFDAAAAFAAASIAVVAMIVGSRGMPEDIEESRCRPLEPIREACHPMKGMVAKKKQQRENLEYFEMV